VNRPETVSASQVGMVWHGIVWFSVSVDSS